MGKLYSACETVSGVEAKVVSAAQHIPLRLDLGKTTTPDSGRSSRPDRTTESSTAEIIGSPLGLLPRACRTIVK